MGLDMYLGVTKTFGKTKLIDAVYWRKANAIHGWFVENVQGGNDNCGDYFVSRAKLKELVTLVEKALKTNQYEKYLPTTEGFFFGGTEYDEWYMDALHHTKNEIQKALKKYPEKDGWNFYYQSSW